MVMESPNSPLHVLINERLYLSRPDLPSAFGSQLALGHSSAHAE